MKETMMSDLRQLDRRGVRRVMTSAVILLTAMMLTATGAAAVGDPGNADTAHPCQKEGWSALMGQDGTTFSSAGACVSYGAHGGVIVPLNHPPDAVDDIATTDKDQTVLIDVLANDVDPDGDALTVSIATQPDHGVATVRDGSVQYVPAAGYFGDDSFTYTITDGLWSDTARVDLTIYACTVLAASPPTLLDDITIQLTIIITPVGVGGGPLSATVSFAGNGVVEEVAADPMPLNNRVPVTIRWFLLSVGTYDVGVQISDGESTGSCRGLAGALTVVDR